MVKPKIGNILITLFLCFVFADAQGYDFGYSQWANGLLPIRRTLRSSLYRIPSAVPELTSNGLGVDQRTQGPNLSSGTNAISKVVSRFRTPRNYPPLFYPFMESGLIPYRRYRRVVPLQGTDLSPRSRSIDTVSGRIGMDVTDQETRGQLRFLGWLFGRPNYSPYPDYTVLEEAAGIGHYGTMSRYPSSLGHSGSAVMVEDCTELFDPITHETIEDCHEVPVYH